MEMAAPKPTKLSRAAELVEAAQANLREALSLLGGVPRSESSKRGLERYMLYSAINRLKAVVSLLMFGSHPPDPPENPPLS